MRYRISKRANRDIETICDRIAKADPDAAERIDAAIHAKIVRAARSPNTGRRHAEISNPRYLCWLVRKWLIVGKIDRSTLTVVRVIYGGRDLRQHVK